MNEYIKRYILLVRLIRLERADVDKKDRMLRRERRYAQISLGQQVNTLLFGEENTRMMEGKTGA